MNHYRLIEAGIWVGALLLAIVSIPRKKIREAFIGFLFMQLISWVLGLMAVEYGMIRYPERLFPEAISTSFTYEFLLLPEVSAIFNLYYPFRRAVWLQALYIIAYPTVLTLLEIVFLHFTKLIVYVHWTWYFSWISILITLLISLLFYRWFVTGTIRLSASNDETP